MILNKGYGITTMRNWFAAFTLMLSSLAIPAMAGQSLQPWQEKALTLVKQEKKVIDAFWRDPARNVLFVAMKPDGTGKDGFAQYLCMQVLGAGAPKGKLTSVFIYDPETYRKYVEKTGAGRKLGWAFCRR